ncbi:MAG: methionine--tRNA ligase [Planctomycetes bacterium]|nr:methionine--tRNA ligase [Planctomycetota bacterium]
MPRHLITSALPYANGPIHFGHVAGAYLPADVYARYLRMKGEQVLYVCGSDEHGVAITLKAEQQGVSYRDYVDRWHGEIKQLFDQFGISFDIWSGTARCPHHAEASRRFFRVLLERGFVFERSEAQWYAESMQRFLPDRYVEGICPQCGFEKARGDECPKCGTWVDAQQLTAPTCTLDGSTPILKQTKHWYLDLPKLQEEGLQDWYQGDDSIRPHGPWKPNVDGYVKAMLKDLQARPITRDLPWGVPVPEELEGSAGKVLYVWFDAPIGYISATMEWAEQKGAPDSWQDWWQGDDTQLVHFIGKDNIAFHVVVFPSMLLGQGKEWNDKSFVLPHNVPANEFYNLQGRKFNTSSGWYIDTESFFQSYSPDSARFYLLLSAPETADAEFTWEGFQNANNSLLADKLGNFASRVIKFNAKRFDGVVPESSGALDDDPQLALADAAFAQIGDRISKFEFKAAAKELMAACDALNQFFDAMAPWKLIKSDDEEDQIQCRNSLERCLAYLELLSRRMAPICPDAAANLREMLGGAIAVPENANQWGAEGVGVSPARLAAGLATGVAQVMFQKIDNDAIEAEVNRLESVVSE